MHMCVISQKSLVACAMGLPVESEHAIAKSKKQWWQVCCEAKMDGLLKPLYQYSV